MPRQHNVALNHLLTFCMPYIRMFLGEQQIDEVFISDVFSESVLGNHFIGEEKQRMLDKHAMAIENTEVTPSFDIYPAAQNSR